MAVWRHWTKPCVVLTLLFAWSACNLDLKFLRQSPCDIHQNYTSRTVWFDCHGRGLRDIPKVFNNITKLDLSENDIQNLSVIAFKDLHLLKHLNLNWINHNGCVNVTTGVFVNLTNLEILRLNGFGFPEVPAQLPKSLKELRLDLNKIFSLTLQSFSKLKNLTHLYLSKNCFYGNRCSTRFEIDNGTFSSLDSLIHLGLSYNNLTHVPRYLPPSLVTLELASNMIPSIGEDDLKELPHLKTLKIQGNCPRCHNAPYPCIPCANGSIDIHERAFDHLRNLELLHLAGNTISVIKKGWFKNISKLRELYLSYNFLMNEIEHGMFLSNLRLLKKLDLSFNYELQSYPETVRLSSAFANLSSLHTLHLEGMVFRKIQKDSLIHLYSLKNLTTLDIGVNFIVNVDQDVFTQFHSLNLLYLSENRLYPVTNSEDGKPGKNTKPLRFSFPDLTLSSEIKLEPYKPIRGLAKPECMAAGRVLDLSRNNLFFISPKQFEGYTNISCLNLSKNGFASALNGTEFTTMPDLKYLDLSFNKIDLAYDHAFEELKKLEVLDLSFNPHYFTVPGVTHNLNFLKNLPKLRVLNMSANSIFTLTTKYMSSDSLEELQFQQNQLGRLWHKDMCVQLFWNLTNLTHLDISSNNIRTIPDDVYPFLPVTLKRFRLSHNGLTDLNWTSMSIFTRLEQLILSHNSLTFISRNITLHIPSLRLLDLSHNQISQLANNFLQDAVNLTMLDLSFNKLTNINQSTFPPNDKITLEMLWLDNNPYRCTCDLMDFILWMFESKVKIAKLATSVRCKTPDAIKGLKVVYFDIKDCLDNDVAILAYSFSTFLVLSVTCLATLMHMFYWDYSYVFYYVKAKLKGYQHLSSGDNVYDAFVTYDTKDPQVSDWVLNHLRIQLEEEGDHILPICLEERDWLPGCPVLDSLTQSIQQSRKTVFVLTHSYVNSGSFKMAMYLAHQRLLDENEDVIVLLLLEPVLQNSHFVRLRRQLCSHSVLEWPRTPAAEPWFWQCLRNSIRVENKAMYSNIYSRYFTIKNGPRKNHKE